MRSPWRSLGEEKPIRTVKEDEQRGVPGDRGGTARRGEARQGVCGDRHQWKRTVQDRGEAKQEEDQEMSVGASVPPEAIVTLTRGASEDSSCNA